MTGHHGVRFPVDLAHITDARHRVAEFVAWQGLGEREQVDFVLAVNELVTNAVQHGGGSGEVRVGRTGDDVWCEVSDRGPGIPSGRDGHALPPARALSGRGLWLVHRLCDEVNISTGDAGTTVRLVTRCTPRLQAG